MSAMNEKDYYAILGVAPDADKKEIQKAFQQKARKLHPDVNKAPDAEERFKEVSEAYAVLSDDQKRARYDALRSGSPFGGAGASRAAASYGPVSGYTQGGFGWSPFGFPFDMGVGAQRRRSHTRSYKPQEGADATIEVELTAQEAKAGVRRGIKYRRFEPCAHCQGSGSIASEHARSCPTCGGAGTIAVDLSTLFGYGVVKMQCPECEGSGKVVADSCPECSGSGRTQVVSEAIVEFPANTHDGTCVRVRGRGHAGTNGGAAGDLVASAAVREDRLEPISQKGFGLVGLTLPFLGIALLMGASSIFPVLCALPLVLGLVFIVQGGVLHRSGVWWKRGLRALLNGLTNSLMWAVVLFLFMSCQSRFYMRPGWY